MRLPILLLFWCLSLSAFAQNETDAPKLADAYAGLEFRNIGPFRGGRSNAATGVPGNPLRYYFGGVGGGVWQTDDAGQSWRNITDGQFNTSSIGAIAVAPSDVNVIYVGTGEHAVRGVMTSAGDGMYKSTDAGKTWTHLGLDDSRHIAEIRIHPKTRTSSTSPYRAPFMATAIPVVSTAAKTVAQAGNRSSTWTKLPAQPISVLIPPTPYSLRRNVGAPAFPLDREKWWPRQWPVQVYRWR